MKEKISKKMNMNSLLVQDWFSLDKGGGEEWIMIKKPTAPPPPLAWKDYVISTTLTWIKDTTRASLADAIAPQLIAGGGTVTNWVLALVLRQYVLSYLF